MLKAKPKADDPAAMQGNMEFAFALLERQQAKTHELNVALAEVQDSTAAKEKLVQVTRSRLQAIGAAHRDTRTKISHEVTVVVQARYAGAVHLNLVYVVSNASWTPAYGEHFARESGLHVRRLVLRFGRTSRSLLSATPRAPRLSRPMRTQTRASRVRKRP